MQCSATRNGRMSRWMTGAHPDAPGTSLKPLEPRNPLVLPMGTYWDQNRVLTDARECLKLRLHRSHLVTKFGDPDPDALLSPRTGFGATSNAVNGAIFLSMDGILARSLLFFCRILWPISLGSETTKDTPQLLADGKMSYQKGGNGSQQHSVNPTEHGWTYQVRSRSTLLLQKLGNRILQ